MLLHGERGKTVRYRPIPCVSVFMLLKQANDEEKPHYRSTQDRKNHGMGSSQAGGTEKGQVRLGMLQRWEREECEGS